MRDALNSRQHVISAYSNLFKPTEKTLNIILRKKQNDVYRMIKNRLSFGDNHFEFEQKWRYEKHVGS